MTLADSEPEPDLSIVLGKRSDYTDHPVTAKLVIEVSVSTILEGRAMGDIYAEAGVEEFWRVNALERCVEAYSEPEGSAYKVLRRVGQDGVVESTALPGLRVSVGGLFAGLPE